MSLNRRIQHPWLEHKTEGGPEFFQVPGSGNAPNGLPYFSWDAAAAQLARAGASWTGVFGEAASISYAFRQSGPVPSFSGISGFAQFNAAQITAVEEALRFWSEVANVTFVRSGMGTSGPDAYSNDATILFGGFVNGPSTFTAFASLPDPGARDSGFAEGDVWMNVSRDYSADPLTFPLGARILLHEIGHALGLLHPSVYDGGAGSGLTYGSDADYFQDTHQFTVMSYFGENHTGAYFGGAGVTPMMHDIAAMQLIYGANLTTRTGDTVYGFNSNAGHAAFSISGPGQTPVFCIWDAGGLDTLDLSGFATASSIDLREESFSSAGTDGAGDSLLGNISIAHGAVIENGYGGAGNDTIIGNAARNVLRGHSGIDSLNGGEGDDTLDGGPGADALNGSAGIDIATYANASAGVTVNMAAPGNNTGEAAGDTFAAIEGVDGTAFGDTLGGDDAANIISGLGGADTISGAGGDDALYGHSAGATGAITATVLASGMDPPVAADSTAADPGFIYVVSKGTGVIWRVDATSGARTAFLDIPNTEFSADGERGVLGLAFHPNYLANGRFFVFLTDPQGDLVVREYHRSTNPAVAETAFTQVIEIAKQTGFSNHNGGWIGFSPTDGYLYISTGDGGGGGDPGNNAQNINVLLGKLLRIDVNSDAFPSDATRNYAVPASNPFASSAGADEIWAYGLRNPWRVSFDPRNGDIYIADVGQERLEELNYRTSSAATGANFGWDLMEGTLTYPPGSPNPGNPALLAPIHEYGRIVGGTIIGGEVYLGPNPGMTGHYVFGDFISDRVFSLFVQNGAAVNIADRTPQIVGAELSNVVDFVSGTDSQLYVISISGTIWRLEMGPGAEDLGDTLNGGEGNDTLDGGAGADRLFGDNGDDIIFWDANDDLANVLGGSGMDALVFTNGAAPTSFNLGAHQFEAAEGRFTDTGGNPWAARSDFYDALWRLDRVLQVHDDGMHEIIDFDQAGGASWASYTERFNILNERSQSVLVYDSGARDSLNYDTANVFTWTTFYWQEDELARRTEAVLVYDDGTRDSNNYDAANNFNWTEFFWREDTLARRTEAVLVYDDGGRDSNIYDAANSFNWTEFYWKEDSLVRRSESVLIYDDGRRDYVNYDPLSNFDWTTFYWREDALGRRSESVLIYDDGSRDSINYDAADAYEWDQFFWREDSLGRRTEDVLIYDDGSRYTKDYDETDAFDWANIFRHYDASGTLTQTIVTYDDGHVVIV